VQLIADAAVRDAVGSLSLQADRAPDVSDDEYRKARALFLEAARLELGIEEPRPR
jgi:hypothetical protein